MGRNIQRVRNFKERINRGTAQAALDFTVVRPVQSGKPAQYFLRHLF